MFWKDCEKDKYREQMEDIFICLSSLNLSYGSWMEVEFDAFFFFWYNYLKGTVVIQALHLLSYWNIFCMWQTEWFNVTEYLAPKLRRKESR